MHKVAWMVLWIMAIGCAKEDIPDTVEGRLLGAWKITSVSGGFSGQGYIPAFSVLYFVDASHYQLLEAKAILGRGTYEVYTEDGEKWVRFTADIAPTQLFESAVKQIRVDASSLQLSDPCCDQYVYQFVRQ